MEESYESTSIYQICPHFALAGDAATKSLFPTEMGCCYHAAPPSEVKIAHQQAFCLTTAHTRCRVFQQPALERFPLELQTAVPHEKRGVGRMAVGVVLTAVLLVGLVSWLANRAVFAQIAEPASPEPTATEVVTLALPTLASVASVPTELPPTVTPLPASPTMLPTETAVPTNTATPAPSPTRPATATASPTASVTLAPQVVVDVDRLNVRSGPSTEYPILAVAEQGTAYTVIGSVSAQDWWQVCCVAAEQVGWVFAGSVLFTGEPAEVPPAVNIPPVPTETAVP